jgi:hypothetical protein
MIVVNTILIVMLYVIIDDLIYETKKKGTN